jgi:Prokaryotic homologs of the JAB domain
MTENLAGVLLSYLSEAGEHERGGVLLGHRNPSVTWVSMAVFPPQLLRDTMACEFDVSSLNVIHSAKDRLDRQLGLQLGTIVGWVHSHPRLGLFLSGTDEGTLSAWRQLDPRAVAVVADPHRRGQAGEQLAWWRAPGPGHRLVLAPSTSPILTIRQVATVAEALSESAGGPGGWDIVTARVVLRIIGG